MRALAWLAALTVLAGCGSSPLTAAPATAWATSLWQDARIFTAVIESIDRARSRVWVEMYEFEREDIAAGLESAQERGADVRVIVDPSVPGSLKTEHRLTAAGLSVRSYPLDDRTHQIDHVKLLLTETQAVVGGMNWGRHSDRNHDYALLSTSRSWLDRLSAIFDQDWSLAGGHPAPLAEAAGPIVQTAPGQGIRQLLAADLASARASVRAELFVLTDPDVIAALAAARLRGVSVRVLLDPNQSVNKPAYRLLRGAGVAVRWYPVPSGAKLHAKAGLFDQRLLLGSANWSVSGLSSNHELDVQTEEPPLVRAFADRFRDDWAASPP